MIDAWWWKWAISNAAVAPIVISVSRGGTTRSRTKLRAEQADEQHDQRAGGQRDERREPGPVDVRAVEVVQPSNDAVWSFVAAITARSPPSRARTPSTPAAASG